MKEYVKIVQIKKLKMKLTFSLDVQNLVGREMNFSSPYQLKLNSTVYRVVWFVYRTAIDCDKTSENENGNL